MKFSVSVLDIQYALKMVKDLKLTAGPLADSTSVLFTVSPDRLVLTGYNGEVLVKTTINTSSDFNGRLVVDCSALFNAVSSFQPLVDGVGTSDINFSVVDKGRKLNLSAKTKFASGAETPHKRAFALFGPEGFPDFSSIDTIQPSFKTKAARLMNGIDGAAYSLSADKSNIIFTGFLLGAEENKLRVVATNGICLSEYSASIEYQDKPISVIVPGTVALRASKSFMDDEDIEVCITDKHFFVRSENLLIGGPLIREEFPDYRPMIAQPETMIEADKKVLLDNILNLSYEASTVSDNRASLVVGKEGVLLLKVGESENSGIAYSGASKDIKIDCNLRLLVSSIKSVYGPTVKMGYSSPESPIHFFSTKALETGAEISSILVPLRSESV